MPRSMPVRSTTALWLGVAMLAGCQSPLDRNEEQRLRDQMLASHRRQLEALSAAPAIEVSRRPSDVEAQLAEEGRIEQLDRMSGPAAYVDADMDTGEDLLGREDLHSTRITLQRAIELGVKNNLDLKIAQLRPAIAEAQLVRAEAVFDAVFFTEAGLERLDTPLPGGDAIDPFSGATGDAQSERLSVTSGIRKRFRGGGLLTLQTALARDERTTARFSTPTYYDADVLVSLEQPLLRGFGRDISTAEILLSESALLQEQQRLQQTLLELTRTIEQAYWNLHFARQRLQVQVRLLERTLDDRNRLRNRAGFDVSPVRLTEANSFVELRRAEVIRARAQLRQQSDLLKRLINDPDLPIADEALLLPVDTPIETPITFSLLEAVQTAIQHRPELGIALASIRDASIRQRVADNARLPLLTLGMSVGLSGIDLDSPGDAYRELAEADYIDYIVSGQFEAPIGNRQAEALHTQRRLEKRAAVINYRNLVQQRVLEVKTALRDVLTAYQLIGATRSARRAAADSLRAIEEQEAAGIALTPEFLLDLKLQTQQRLADAEIQEAEALANYNIAIATFYEGVGTLLKRNGIVFETMPNENSDETVRVLPASARP